MKNLIQVSFFLLLLSTSALSQNEVRLRINNLLIFNANEEVFTNDRSLLIIPNENARYQTYGIDMSYLMNSESPNRWGIRFGYNRTSSSSKVKTSSENEYGDFSNTRNNLSLWTGITSYSRFWQNTTGFSSEFIGNLNFGYRFPSQRKLEINYFDKDDNFLRGAISEYSNPEEWWSEIGIGASFGKKILKNFKVGIENNIFLNLNKRQGITTEYQNTRNSFNEIQELTIEYHENNFSLLFYSQISFYTSLTF